MAALTRGVVGRFLRQRDGHTLMEVIAATVVFLIGAMALSALLMQGYRAMGSAGSRSITVHSAEKHIEEAIKDPTGSSGEVTRVPHAIEVFGQEIHGTLITVTKTLPGEPNKIVTYTTFVPYGGDE